MADNQADNQESSNGREEAENGHGEPSGGNNGPHNGGKVLLIAHAKAHLVTGESFDLLPIRHEEDVKSALNDLIESWASSGFLLRERFLYPWHQVRHIEVLSVEELPQREAHLKLEELYAADRAKLQESFWKTRKKAPKKDETKGGNGHGADEAKRSH